jgi:subtilisin family serine protease/beta-lactam-binding protein with PASTA domain
MSDEKRYIIRLKKDADKGKVKKHLDKVNSNGKGKQAKLSHRGKFIFADESSIEEIKALSQIAYVEEDKQVDLLTVPNDTLYSSQWNLKNTGQFGGTVGVDIGSMESTWTLEQGETTVIIGVCDTGIDLEHEDLIDNLWTNAAPTFGDVHGVRGINGALDGDCTDFYGHGTHVAGIIAAKGNNGKGVAGIAWNVKLMSLRFFNPAGGFVSDAINVIEYGVDNGCSIINHSWGGSIFSQALSDVWDDAVSDGVIMVCAAGNDGKNNDVWAKYPASFTTSNNVAVASITNTGENSYFTNTGIVGVDIGAPGGAVSGVDDTNILSCWLDNTYQAIAGTSMASPHVAGALALLKSYYAGFTIPTVNRLLAACITPTTGQFLTTKWGGRININRLLTYSSASNSITIARDGVTDITITPNPTDPTENLIYWTDPTDGLFAKTFVHRLAWCFPDDVNPDQVEVYSGDLEEVTDTGLEQGVVYGYRFQASYSDGKLSLPIYVRSRGGGEPFACPVPPSGFDFICDYWDEAWGGVSEVLSLNDVAMPVQAWRAAMSKLRTRGGHAVFPNGIIGFYRTEKPEPPVVPTVYDWHLDPVPNTPEMMSFQTIKEGAIFLENLINMIRELLLPIELYSTRMAANKWFVWMDYYKYIATGTIKRYNPPASFFEWDWEDYKLRDRWHDIYEDATTVLANLRVLYTAAPPYSTVIEDFTVQDTYSSTITDGENEITRTFQYPFYADPVPTEADSTPPAAPVDPLDAQKVSVSGDITTLYNNASYGDPYYHTDDNIMIDDVVDIENVKMVNPLVYLLLKLSLSTRAYAREVWFYCQSALKEITSHSFDLDYWWYAEDRHMTLDWTDSTPITITLNTPGTSVVSSAYFGEEPESDDPDDVGIKMGVFSNYYEGGALYNSSTQFINQQNRNMWYTNGKLVLGSGFDWESYPTNFNVVLVFQAGNAGFTPNYTTNVPTYISPIDNTDGHVLFEYTYWDTVWDEEGGYTHVPKSGSIALNATTLYKLYGNNKGYVKLGDLYVDSNDTTEWEFSMTTSLAEDTLPHLWKSKLYESYEELYIKWWTAIYRVTGTSTFDFDKIETEGETPEMVRNENRYCLGRWGSINVYLQVMSDFDFYDEIEVVPAHKVPNLIGLTADEDDDTIVPFVDDYITAWNADTDNPQVAEGLVNAQPHWDAPENRIISQSPPPDALLPYGEHDALNALPISITVCSGAPSKDIDKSEGYDIPKVTGMTVAEAIAFLASDYPTWDIDEDYTTEQFSINVPEGQIVSQNPDWQIRTTVFDKTIAVSVSLGAPEGKVITDLRGETLTDALTALEAINCDCPESHRVEQYHPTVPDGSIIAQLPSGLPYRATSDIVTNVGLCISMGAAPDGDYNIAVPMVIGRNISDDYMTTELEGWNIVQIPVYCEGDTGLIVDQIPRYGAAMGALDTQRLIISVAARKPLVAVGSEEGVKK